MKNISAFLIDLNRSSSSALAQSLRSIFTSKNHLDIRLDEDAAFRPASNGSPVELAGRILRSDPDVVFMIMPEDPGAIEQALIRILSREPGRIPVVAVIEESRPGYMIELLKLGAVDFLTPPIRDIDVVPRIWRIVEHARKPWG
jgi:two-component system, NtrC family, response regulator GlrR